MLELALSQVCTHLAPPVPPSLVIILDKHALNRTSRGTHGVHHQLRLPLSCCHQGRLPLLAMRCSRCTARLPAKREAVAGRLAASLLDLIGLDSRRCCSLRVHRCFAMVDSCRCADLPFRRHVGKGLLFVALALAA